MKFLNGCVTSIFSRKNLFNGTIQLTTLLFEYLNILGYLSLSIGKHLLQYLTESIGRIYVDVGNKIFLNAIIIRKSRNHEIQ